MKINEKIQYIKNEFKKFKFVQKILIIRNTHRVKSGKMYNTYGSWFDMEARKVIASELKNVIDNAGSVNLRILILASPSCRELSLLPEHVLRRLDVICVDKTLPSENVDFPLNSYQFIYSDVFEICDNKDYIESFDIVVNRWFFHHLSEANKIKVCNKSFQLIKDGGCFLMVDWFMDEWATPSDLYDSLLKFYSYRAKYLPHHNKKVQFINEHNELDYWWERMHDDKDWKGMKHPTRNRVYDAMADAGFIDIKFNDFTSINKVDDPKAWGNTIFKGFVSKK